MAQLLPLCVFSREHAVTLFEGPSRSLRGLPPPRLASADSAHLTGFDQAAGRGRVAGAGHSAGNPALLTLLPNCSLLASLHHASPCIHTC